MSITKIKIQTEDFDFAEHYSQIRASGGEAVGAIAGFVGLVRDYNAHAGDGGEVTSLTLEHYPGMTESSIEAIVQEAEGALAALGDNRGPPRRYAAPFGSNSDGAYRFSSP